MSLIFLATASMGGLAALFAVVPSLAHKRLKVEGEPRVARIVDALPDGGYFGSY